MFQAFSCLEGVLFALDSARLFSAACTHLRAAVIERERATEKSRKKKVCSCNFKEYTTPRNSYIYYLPAGARASSYRNDNVLTWFCRSEGGDGCKSKIDHALTHPVRALSAHADNCSVSTLPIALPPAASALVKSCSLVSEVSVGASTSRRSSNTRTRPKAEPFAPSLRGDATVR